MRHMFLSFCAAALVFSLAACTTSELYELTAAKEDFNKATQRVVNYELLPRCTDAVTAACGNQATVNLLVDDVNSCNTTINDGGNSGAVRGCTTKLEGDLSANKVP